MRATVWFVAVTLVGCASGGGQRPETREPERVASSEPEPPPPAEPPAEPPVKPPDEPPVEHATGLPEVVAEIDGVKITRDAFLKHAVDWWGRETLEEIILRHIVDSAVRKYGVSIREEEMDARVAVEIKAREADVQERYKVTLAQYLKGFGKTVEDFRKELAANENFRRQIILEYMVKYAYTIEPLVHLRHIKVRDKKKADDLRRRIADGDSFEKIAEQESDDLSTADRGGLLAAPFIRGMSRLGEVYETAAFALQNKGDLSPVVHVDQVYYIIRLEDRRAGQNVTFDAVRPQILKMQMDRATLDQWIRRLRLDHARSVIYHARNLQPVPASK